MSKVVKVNHVVLTMRLSPHGAGMARDEVDRLVNARLAEGYDTVEVYPQKTNLSERQEVTDVVILYVFKAHAEDVAEVKAKK